MRSGVLSLILIWVTSLTSNAEDDYDAYLHLIAILVDSDVKTISEEKALGYFQKDIDGAKKKVAQHKGPDPEVLERLLSAQDLDAHFKIDWSDGCTFGGYDPLRMIRNGESLTLELSLKKTITKLKFSLVRQDLPDQAIQVLLNEFNTIIEKLATAPSRLQWLADSTPEELLERGRNYSEPVGGPGFAAVAVTLKDSTGELKLINKEGWCFEEMKGWHEAVTKLTSAPQKER